MNRNALDEAWHDVTQADRAVRRELRRLCWMALRASCTPEEGERALSAFEMARDHLNDLKANARPVWRHFAALCTCGHPRWNHVTPEGLACADPRCPCTSFVPDKKEAPRCP